MVRPWDPPFHQLLLTFTWRSSRSKPCHLPPLAPSCGLGTLTTPLWFGHITQSHWRSSTPTSMRNIPEYSHHGRGLWKKTPLPDAMVVREGDTVYTTVCHKPTHTNRYSTTHHTTMWDNSRVLSQPTRSSNHHLFTNQIMCNKLTHLTQGFHCHGYPKPPVKWLLARTPPTKLTKEDDEDDDHIKEPKRLYIPCVKGAGEKIERECHHLCSDTFGIYMG